MTNHTYNYNHFLVHMTGGRILVHCGFNPGPTFLLDLGLHGPCCWRELQQITPLCSPVPPKPTEAGRLPPRTSECRASNHYISSQGKLAATVHWHKYSCNGMLYIYLAIGRQGWCPGDRLHQLCVRPRTQKGCSTKRDFRGALVRDFNLL